MQQVLELRLVAQALREALAQQEPLVMLVPLEQVLLRVVRALRAMLGLTAMRVRQAMLAQVPLLEALDRPEPLGRQVMAVQLAPQALGPLQAVQVLRAALVQPVIMVLAQQTEMPVRRALQGMFRLLVPI